MLRTLHNNWSAVLEAKAKIFVIPNNFDLNVSVDLCRVIKLTRLNILSKSRCHMINKAKESACFIYL